MLNAVHPLIFHFWFFFFIARQPQWDQVPSLLRFRDYFQLEHTTLGRTPLDESSTYRRDLYLTTHNILERLPCPRTVWDPQSQEASGGAATPRPCGHRDRPHFYEIHLNIIIIQISASQTVYSFRIFLLNLCVYLLYPPHKLHLRPYHSRIDRIINVWWRIKVTKVLITLILSIFILNKNPTRRNSMQSGLFYCKITLHVSGVTVPIIRRPDRDCSPDQATLKGSSCADIMTCTGGYGYSF